MIDIKERLRALESAIARLARKQASDRKEQELIEINRQRAEMKLPLQYPEKQWTTERRGLIGRITRHACPHCGFALHALDSNDGIDQIVILYCAGGRGSCDGPRGVVANDGAKAQTESKALEALTKKIKETPDEQGELNSIAPP